MEDLDAERESKIESPIADRFRRRIRRNSIAKCRESWEEETPMTRQDET
jgi:hypothetical protein